MIRSLLVCVAIGALPVAAQDKPQPFAIDGVEWGRVRQVMEPDYPSEALARKVRVHVDIVGRLNGFGALEEATYEAESDDARLLVAPLKDVLRFWRFTPAMTEDCQPTTRLVRTRVWFDLSGEKPGMSVSELRPPAGAPTGAPALPAMKVERRVEPRYPTVMQRRGWQSDVFAKVVVAPSGAVVSVVANAYPKIDGYDLEPFEHEVTQTLSRWRFDAAPGLLENRYTCYPVSFRLTD